MGEAAGLASWVKAAPPAEVPSRSGPHQCAIAIPARDEAELVARCLMALAAQQRGPDFAVVLFLNNCRDDTAQRVADVAQHLPFPLHVYESDLDPTQSDAAWARRLALNAAALLVRPDGVVLSTDADSYADPDWVGACLDGCAAGADVVCGFVAPDFSDAPSLDFESLRQAAFEYEYSQAACELLCLVDPDPRDPWPRHQTETGANLAVRVSTLRHLGGIPHVCPGEDQAFVRLAEQAGFSVRHDFRPQVTTSSRLRGRAVGGWSDDVKARAERQHAYCHEKLEPAGWIMRRARLRAGLRRRFGGDAFAAHAARLVADANALERVCAAQSFDQAWAILQATSSLLAPRRLRLSALEANRERLNEYLVMHRSMPAAVSPTVEVNLPQVVRTP